MVSASVTAVSAFVDEPAAWLHYLARATGFSIAERWSASELVILGRFRDWTSTIEVTDTLKGASPGGIVALELTRPDGAGEPSVTPGDGDLVLAFLVRAGAEGRWKPVAMPGAVVPSWSVDDLEAEAGAARWFAGLPAEPDERTAALCQGVSHASSLIRANAFRAIACERMESAIPCVRASIETHDDVPTAVLATVCLWLLGRHDDAVRAFTAIYERAGRNRVMDLWHVQETAGSAQPPTLFGPDPGAGGDTDGDD